MIRSTLFSIVTSFAFLSNSYGFIDFDEETVIAYASQEPLIYDVEFLKTPEMRQKIASLIRLANEEDQRTNGKPKFGWTHPLLGISLEDPNGRYNQSLFASLAMDECPEERWKALIEKKNAEYAWLVEAGNAFAAQSPAFAKRKKLAEGSVELPDAASESQAKRVALDMEPAKSIGLDAEVLTPEKLISPEKIQEAVGAAPNFVKEQEEVEEKALSLPKQSRSRKATGVTGPLRRSARLNSQRSRG